MADAKLPVALQMYTLRDVVDDLERTFARLAALGFAGIELAGMYDKTADEIKCFADRNGLRIVGMHEPVPRLRHALDQVIRDAGTLDTQYVVCPVLPAPMREDEAAYRKAPGMLNAVGRRLKEEGLTFCYHHHALEFEVRVGDAYALDYLLSETDPDDMKVELDTFWVRLGGEDPVDYIHKYAGRVPLLHVKDRSADADKPFAEVGYGTLDWDGILSAAGTSGVEHLIVEQDVCYCDPWKAVEKSLGFLNGFAVQ